MKRLVLASILFGLFFAGTVFSAQSDSSGTKHPYPQNLKYTLPNGKEAILPNVPRETMNIAVAGFYDEWKGKYLVKEKDGSLYRVNFGSKEPEKTVSEGQGYGMIITAIMAGHDPEAQNIFNGLYRYAKAHPSAINPNFMSWINTENSNSAFDGDADIALALLLADTQWGSNGEIDYLSAAKTIITAIKDSVIGKTSKLPLLGDWVNQNGEKYNQNTPRSSDFMLDNFHAFAAATGDSGWNTAITNIHTLIEQVQKNYSSATGLLPDFIENGKPARPGFLEGDNDGCYSYNACRDPWRLGVDALLNKDGKSLAEVGKMSEWIVKKADFNPKKVKAGYTLDGNELVQYDTAVFIAPFGVAAMTQLSQQAWLTDIYKYSINRRENYFENTVNMLCLLVMSGNYWNPMTFSNQIKTAK